MDNSEYKVQVSRAADDDRHRLVRFFEFHDHARPMSRSEFVSAMKRHYPDVIDPFTWRYVNWTGGDPQQWPPDPAGPH